MRGIPPSLDGDPAHFTTAAVGLLALSAHFKKTPPEKRENVG